MTNPDPLEEGREELTRLAHKYAVDNFKGARDDPQQDAEEAFEAGWTARAARERELLKALRQLKDALNPNVLSGISRWADEYISFREEEITWIREAILRAEAALSEIQPACECEENDCHECGPRMNGN